MDQVMLIDAQDDRQNVVLGLREAGFGVREEIDSESAVRQVKEDPHQIIVVDEAMPGTSSKELLIALREITESPIVIIGEGGETAMVEALMKGADLYLERPIVVPELAARLRALGRRYDQEVGLNGYLRTLDDSGQLAKIFEKLSQTEAKTVAVSAGAGR